MDDRPPQIVVTKERPRKAAPPADTGPLHPPGREESDGKVRPEPNWRWLNQLLSLFGALSVLAAIVSVLGMGVYGLLAFCFAVAFVTLWMLFWSLSAVLDLLAFQVERQLDQNELLREIIAKK